MNMAFSKDLVAFLVKLKDPVHMPYGAIEPKEKTLYG
jgi:hypothetical protein